MRRYNKNFFTKKSAENFIKELKNNGRKGIELWEGLDGFGQKQYTVKWN